MTTQQPATEAGRRLHKVSPFVPMSDILAIEAEARRSIIAEARRPVLDADAPLRLIRDICDMELVVRRAEFGDDLRTMFVIIPAIVDDALGTPMSVDLERVLFRLFAYTSRARLPDALDAAQEDGGG